EQNLAAMQREMRLTQGMVETIVESAPAALAIFDTDLRYLRATHQWLELFALEADAIAGNRHGDLASADTAAIEGGLGRALEGHVVDDDLQQVGRRADGEAGWLALRHAPWRDARGRIAGAVSTARPATAEVRERQETAREVDELRRVNRDLESFAALVAHDIRAPLSAIQRKMSTLDNSDTDDATTLSGIGETLQRALDIVDGVLEFTTAGGSAGPAHALDVEGLVRRIAGETTRGTPFTYEVSGTWPMLTTAVAPLDLALRNLMQNTVKHHDLPQGRIHVSVADAGKHWHFDIADDGPGIPVAQHDAIFEPLVTAGDDTQARSTGLGLAFVRRAAESVGGQIRVMSDPDVHRGTTFRIVWPK
ncbi:MAG: sensor histidine kinase, partial [Hyphomicrobiaceae bacterium]